MNIVECKDLSKIYEDQSQKVVALNSVSLSIVPGEFVSFVGPSGSGKTTLLNLIGALDSPTSGSIILDGVDLSTLSNREQSDLRLRSIGFVFQAYNLIPVLSARENVEFVMHLQGIRADERRTRAKEVLISVGLEGLFDRRPGELSGGQQQRVAVARAIVSKPKLVLADEPTANLDSTTAQNLIGLMRSLNEKFGITFIFSTHDPIVMGFARRVVKLRDGAIEEEVRA